MSELHKSLTTFRGTALFMNIVVGAGLLSLPGLSVAAIGDHALWAWVLCAVIATPLLWVFIIMGKRYPNAGGVGHFAYMAFGSYGHATTSMILLGAVCFGLPSVALSGGYYAIELLPGDPAIYAILLVVLSALVHLAAAETVAKISAWVASGVILVLLVFIAIGFTVVPWHTENLSVATWVELDWMLMLSPFMMIFFAFTGWEVGAGSSEEFRNPERDFPCAMVLSYLAVCVLYFATVFIVQVADASQSPVSAFAAIAEKVAGAWGHVLMSLLACLMVFANLIGAIWAVSRLVFALSREGYIPFALRVSARGTPISSVVIVGSMLSGVLSLEQLGIVDIALMLVLAGQNFLILFAVVAAALFKLSRETVDCLVAGSAFLLVAVLVVLEGQFILYPIGTAALGLLVAYFRNYRQSR